MALEWISEFQDGQTRAVCSKCGVPYRWPSEIVKLNDGYFYCLRKCKEQTVLARDKLIAQSRKRRELPPPKFVQAPRYADDFLQAEDAVLKTLLRGLPTSTDPTEIGWGLRYLCDMVLENKRPARWTNDAKTLIVNRANFLLTLQYGAPLGPQPSITSEKLRYGGFADGSNLYTSITTIAGAALAKAYSIFGTQTYLDAATRCGHFLRHMQCQDLDNNGNQSQYGGGAYHVGGFAEGCSASGSITWVQRYNVFDTAGVWLYGLLRSLLGDSYVVGGVAGTDFTAATTATLVASQAEAVTFITVGARDTAFGGNQTTGLSSTYPRSYYAPTGPTSTGLGTWALTPATVTPPSSVLVGVDFAVALFALDAAGQGAATVASVFDWLMAFSSNPMNVPPAEDPLLLIGNQAGTYNPKVALATELDVLDDDGVTVLSREHIGSGYNWLAAGLLAAISSVRIPTEFATAKDDLGTPVPYSNQSANPQLKYIGETGYSGLSLQYSGPQS